MLGNQVPEFRFRIVMNIHAGKKIRQVRQAESYFEFATPGLVRLGHPWSVVGICPGGIDGLRGRGYVPIHLQAWPFVGFLLSTRLLCSQMLTPWGVYTTDSGATVRLSCDYL